WVTGLEHRVSVGREDLVTHDRHLAVRSLRDVEAYVLQVRASEHERDVDLGFDRVPLLVNRPVHVASGVASVVTGSAPDVDLRERCSEVSDRLREDVYRSCELLGLHRTVSGVVELTLDDVSDQVENKLALGTILLLVRAD